MNVLIMNAADAIGDRAGLAWLTRYSDALRARGDSVETIAIASMDIGYCNGCWSCWWATPGLCAKRDDMAVIYPKVMASDMVVWFEPLALGATPALAKKVQDRMIPLIHPYIELVGGESHHRRRYAKYPDIGLVTAAGPGDGSADIAMTRAIHERLAINMRGAFRFFATTERDPAEAAHETHRD